MIGAGSVVTKDVGPYEIVAGNPARAIRMRFDERQIAALESSRWWELDRHELADRIGELDAMLQNPEIRNRNYRWRDEFLARSASMAESRREQP